jgi:arylsulfatase A-like enzyme
MAQQMDKVAVINSMNSTQGAHAQGRYYMHTSYFMRGTIEHPDLGAYSSLLLAPSNGLLPNNVKIGGNSSGLGGGFLESKYAAVPIGDPEAGLQHSQLPNRITESRFERRLARVRQMNKQFGKQYDTKAVRAYAGMYDDAVKLMKSEDLQAFDLTLESAATRARYGDDKFAQGVLLARRLVEHDVRYVEVDYGGWDTHTDNFTRVAEKGAVLDRAMGALLADLSERGLLNETLVVLATEFGRTPEIVTDRNNGRNHYPKAFTCLLAGGGIRGGQRWGKTDNAGREVIDDQVTVPDFNATIAHALGLSLKKKVYSPTKRPFTVADKGKPLSNLFG